MPLQIIEGRLPNFQLLKYLSLWKVPFHTGRLHLGILSLSDFQTFKSSWIPWNFVARWEPIPICGFLKKLHWHHSSLFWNILINPGIKYQLRDVPQELTLVSLIEPSFLCEMKQGNGILQVKFQQTKEILISNFLQFQLDSILLWYFLIQDLIKIPSNISI